MKRMLFALLWSTVFLSTFSAASVLAQDESSINLRLTRNFGTGIGTRIQGTFTMQVTGPEDLVRVVFYLDDQIIGEDDMAPFRWQFRTDSHAPGAHRLGARGYTANGNELEANTLTRHFLSQAESSRLTTALVVTLILLVVGGRLLTTWVTNRGQGSQRRSAISGVLGGTICPNCGRPYALHLWGINLMAARLDRCPHCGKWRLVRRTSNEALQAAAEGFEDNAQETPPDQTSQDGDWRQQLDDSRFDDSP